MKRTRPAPRMPAPPMAVGHVAVPAFLSSPGTAPRARLSTRHRKWRDKPTFRCQFRPRPWSAPRLKTQSYLVTAAAHEALAARTAKGATWSLCRPTVA
jgi:hypothetical protein